jgi:hypothetical protein
MRVLFIIRIVVVPTVHCYPQGRRELQRERAENGQCVLEPKRTREAAVRYQSMEAEIDPEYAKRENSHDQE